MKLSLIFTLVLTAMTAWSQVRPGNPRPPQYGGHDSYQTESEIHELTREILDVVRKGYLNKNQLDTVRDGLKGVLASTYSTHAGSDLICTKQSNAMFYPVSSKTGSVVGSTSFNAGYSSLESCRSTLPGRYDVIACFKQSNAMFYPTNPATGSVIGSTSFNAGYSSVDSCKQTLPKPYAKVACFKQSNGLFYPSDVTTGSVIGSTSFNAGYSSLDSCLQVVNQ